MKRLFIIGLLFLSVYVNGQMILPAYSGGRISHGTTIDYNDTADAFFARMSVPPTTARKIIISQFFDTIQKFNIDDSLDFLYMLVAADTNTAKLDLIGRHNLSGHAPYNFIPDGGINVNYGNNSLSYERYFSSTYNPTTAGNKWGLNHASLGIYTLDEEASSAPVVASSTGADYIEILPRVGHSSLRRIALNSSTNATFTNTVQKGYFAGVRVSNSQIKGYVNGDSIGILTCYSTAIPNLALPLFRYNADGVLQKGSLYGRVGTAWGGGKLSTTQNKALYRAIDRYMIATGAKGSENYFVDPDIKWKITPFPTHYKHVERTRGNKQFAYDDDTIYYSIDGGVTWPYKKYFAADEKIEIAWLFNNGNILFGTRESPATLYLSTDNLATLTNPVLKNADGSDYTFHTPVNATYPGSYYATCGQTDNIDYLGTDIAMWGNYGNVQYGANAVNIYATFDQGVTVKVVYRFGIQTYWRDNGAATPSHVAGNYLGYATNPLNCRHVHEVLYHAQDTSFWVLTGDHSEALTDTTCYWMKGKYDSGTGLLTMTVIATNNNSRRYINSGAAFFSNGDSVMWIAEDKHTTTERGIWRAAYTDIADLSKHKRVYDPGASVELIHLKLNGNHAYSSISGRRGLLISSNGGLLWKWVSMPLLNATGLYGIWLVDNENTDGYIRLYDGTTYSDAATYFVKIKTDYTPPAPLSPPTLLTPANGDTGKLAGVKFTWSTVTDANTYDFQLATDNNFTSLIRSDTALTVINDSVWNLDKLTTYYWRARAIGLVGASAYSSVFNFTTSVTLPDIDARSFLDSAKITNTTVRNAIDAFVSGLKTDTLWTKMIAVYPMVADSGTFIFQHKWNLKDPRDLNAAYRVTFYKTPTHSAYSVAWNGSTQYGDTHTQASNYVNNIALSYYSQTNNNIGEDIGTYTSGTQTCALDCRVSGVGYGDSYNNTSGQGRLTASVADGTGFYITSRTSSAYHSLYRNGIKLGSNTGSGGTAPTVDIWIGRIGTSLWGTKTCSFAAVTYGLADWQCVKFSARVNALETALGVNKY